MSGDNQEIRISSVYMPHSQGTKFYKIYHFSRGDRSILATRWGKVGSFGEMLVRVIGSNVNANSEADSVISAKEKRGYRRDINQNAVAKNHEEFKKKIGIATYSKLGRDALEHLFEDEDFSGAREADPPVYFDENGRPQIKRRTAEISKEQLALMAKQQFEKREDEVAKAYSDNTLYGSF